MLNTPQNPTVPTLSVITVTWNGKAYVEECIGSLVRQQLDIPVELIVIDNASSDGTPEMIEERFPSVRLVRNAANLGFAKANNIGIRLSRGDYLCLVNSDVVAPAECLSKLYSYISVNPTIGLIGPRMMSPNGIAARSCMRFPTIRAYFCYAFGLDLLAKERFPFTGFLMRRFTWDRTEDVDVLNGWFVLARREAVQQVGLLDERFFIYGEDIDWSYRFRRAGWRRVYYAGSEALHYGGASSSREPIRFYLEMIRANLQFWSKHYGALAGYMCTSGVIAHELIRIAAYSIQGGLCPGRRDELLSKRQRSVACLKWLLYEGRCLNER